MRAELYDFLVNRKPGIRYRYQKKHVGAGTAGKLYSYAYLMGLNAGYHLFRIQAIGERPDMKIYEEKKLPLSCSESALYRKEHPELRVEHFVKIASAYDVISFDVFDTLLLRPFAKPVDVFHLMGERLGLLGFQSTRIEAEKNARLRCQKERGHMEITLVDIWKELSETVGCDPEAGMRLEQETEESLCYGNPFLLAVWKQLQAMGKRLIIVSDMYLPADCIRRMLEKAGFTGFEQLFVSCEWGKNKAGGTIFPMIQQMVKTSSILHIGDHPNSDVLMPQKCGWSVLPYPKVDLVSEKYRPMDQSALIGSAYRGLVSNHLYNGIGPYSMEYEYGYLYGGLFVLGYCNFIHTYCQQHGVEKILFLARDGDILKQVYDQCYPEDCTAYAYWSRKAATKLMASFDQKDYFRRMIHHKINQKYRISDVLQTMELTALSELLAADSSIALQPDDFLTSRNALMLEQWIRSHWDLVEQTYQNAQAGAKQYYGALLSGVKKAVAVDIGWAGSGAMALSYLLQYAWKIPCELTGLIAGTNTLHDEEPDASEPFLQSGKLVSYLYSQSLNRDLMKKHDSHRDYNVFWELLLSSPTRQFNGFGLDEAGKTQLQFGALDPNQRGIQSIQKGIRDFAAQYRERFAAYPYFMEISGRDAYAPMLVAASRKEAYLRRIKQKFGLEINVT